jgi:hypothetical protein
MLLRCPALVVPFGTLPISQDGLHMSITVPLSHHRRLLTGKDDRCQQEYQKQRHLPPRNGHSPTPTTINCLLAGSFNVCQVTSSITRYLTCNYPIIRIIWYLNFYYNKYSALTPQDPLLFFGNFLSFFLEVILWIAYYWWSDIDVHTNTFIFTVEATINITCTAVAPISLQG